MTERNGNSSGEDGPEFTVEGPEMTRRSMLAGTAGLGFITSYDPTNAPNNVQAAQGKDGPSRSNEPISIGSRLQLFVDDYIISEMDSVEQRLHSPDPQDVAITFDEPWEGGGSSYITVFWDGEISRYRMYYRGAGIPPYGSFNERTCYAESEDGVNWEKPSLDLVEFNGSRDNNIILDKDPDSHNFQPFKDPNPDADPEAKYKAVGGTGELYALRSPDGIHWERVSDDRILAGKGAFDSQNVAFWDPVNEEYRAYFRYFDSGRRAIKTAVSDDFQNWTEVTELEYPDAPAEQLYINGINPYYRAPHIFLGFPGRYIERDWESNSMRKLPDWEFRQQRAETFSLRQGAALSDTLFMSSRDRETFRRWDRTFHRPGRPYVGRWRRVR
ncbi:MAG: hypothetical protein V5A25_07505, partial [Halovenus sp.]